MVVAVVVAGVLFYYCRTYLKYCTNDAAVVWYSKTEGNFFAEVIFVYKLFSSFGSRVLCCTKMCKKTKEDFCIHITRFFFH